MSTCLDPSEHVLTRSMSGEPRCQLIFSSCSPVLLLCLLLTTLHPNRRLASMSGHKLPASPDPNCYLSIAESVRRLFSQCLMITQNALLKELIAVISGQYNTIRWAVVVELLSCFATPIGLISRCIIVILHYREWQYYLY